MKRKTTAQENKFLKEIKKQLHGYNIDTYIDATNDYVEKSNDGQILCGWHNGRFIQVRYNVVEEKLVPVVMIEKEIKENKNALSLVDFIVSLVK